MPVTPVVAAYVPTYASTEPYITADEYLAAPTGTDTTQLLPGSGVGPNRAAYMHHATARWSPAR